MYTRKTFQIQQPPICRYWFMNWTFRNREESTTSILIDQQIMTLIVSYIVVMVRARAGCESLRST